MYYNHFIQIEWDVILYNNTLYPVVPAEASSSKISTAISSMTEQLRSTLDVALPKADLPSFAITLSVVAVIIAVTYVLAKVVDRVLAFLLPRVIRAEAIGVNLETEKTFHTVIRKLSAAVIYTIGIFLVIVQVDLGLLPAAITLLTIAMIAIVTCVVARVADRMLLAYEPLAASAGVTGIDIATVDTLRIITRRILVATIYTIGLLLVVFQIEPLSKAAATLLAGAGVIGLVIGFAAKSSLSNVVSGVFLALFHPIRVGDYVDFKGDYGQIEDITLRHTVIHTWDGRRIMVPNSVMDTESIINWTIRKPEIAWTINIGIAYTADIDKARQIILETAKRHPLVLKNRDITVRVTELGDFAVNLRLYVHVPHRDVAYTTGCEIMEAVKKNFDKEGIEIPYPYQNLIIHRPDHEDPQGLHIQDDQAS